LCLGWVCAPTTNNGNARTNHETCFSCQRNRTRRAYPPPRHFSSRGGGGWCVGGGGVVGWGWGVRRVPESQSNSAIGVQCLQPKKKPKKLTQKLRIQPPTLVLAERGSRRSRRGRRGGLSQRGGPLCPFHTAFRSANKTLADVGACLTSMGGPAFAVSRTAVPKKHATPWGSRLLAAAPSVSAARPPPPPKNKK